MINYKKLEIIQKEFEEIKNSMDEKTLEKALGFGTKKDKILSLFSITCKASKKLINDSSLVYGFVYKNDYYLNGNSNYFKSWILYSPSVKYEENPSKYSKIAAKLHYFLENPPKKYKHLSTKLLNNDNDFSLLELPKDVFGDKFFVFTTYQKEKVNPSLKVGVQVCLINQKFSKKFLILPEIFFKKDSTDNS